MAPLKKKKSHIQNEIKISFLNMQRIQLCNSSECCRFISKAPISLFQFSRNYPTRRPKEIFPPRSCQANNPYFPSSSPWFSFKTNTTIRRRPVGCFLVPKTRRMFSVLLRRLGSHGTQLSVNVPNNLRGSKSPRTSLSLAAAYPQMLSPPDTNPPPPLSQHTHHFC